MASIAEPASVAHSVEHRRPEPSARVQLSFTRPSDHGPIPKTLPDENSTPYRPPMGPAKARTGFTLLTQGCPFRCSFCVIWPANLGLYRKRPIPEIIADLKSMEESYVYLGDDNTFADAKYAEQLADASKKPVSGKKYPAIAGRITSASIRT